MLNAQMDECTNAQMHKCTNAQMYNNKTCAFAFVFACAYLCIWTVFAFCNCLLAQKQRKQGNAPVYLHKRNRNQRSFAQTTTQPHKSLLPFIRTKLTANPRSDSTSSRLFHPNTRHTTPTPIPTPTPTPTPIPIPIPNAQNHKCANEQKMRKIPNTF